MVRRGEAVFTLLLLGASVFLLVEAYGIDGIGRWDSAGSIPLIATSVMIVTAGFVLFRTLTGGPTPRSETQTKPDAPGPSPGPSREEGVLSVNLAGVLGLLLAYVVLIGVTGFFPATLVFIAATITFLQRGRPIQAIVIAAVSVAAIYGAFETFFQVRLP